MPEDTTHQSTPPEKTPHSGTSTLGQTYLPLSPSHIANPYAFYAHARQEEPVFFSPYVNAWIITRYEDALTVLKDHQRFAAALADSGVEKLTPEVLRLLGSKPLMQAPLIVMLDPPDHTRLRKSLAKAFSAQRIASLEPKIRTLANRLIDHVASSGHMDFVEDFALSFPIAVSGGLLNVAEEDMRQIQRGSGDLLTLMYAAPPAEEQLALAQNACLLLDFMYDLAQERQRTPKDDIVSDLYRAVETGEAPFSSLEVAGLLYVLLLAGFETTSKFLGKMLLHVLRERSLWETIVANQSLIPQVIEEALRFDPSVLTTLRVAREDVVIGGKTIEKGQRVQVVLASANHDEAIFPNPDRFHHAHERASRHIAFGYGIHFCIGSPLARLESRIALEQLSQRLPSLRLVAGQDIIYMSHLTVHSLKHLLVEWDH